ncbi:flavodoxin family protein [Pseudoalteromonas sp. MMG010]|uniref:flavodoxin family protein n=1 Tax=Pseudoalteromonas sp. MMG010 TaxID=2822685 RepID=UPI001B3A55E3|nr:NAD(P)H-dependent oxidoreductase [Pseudoalteromonas sp. MMG010]MBQ4833823.1 flavodoxin family protein [Pseudoalteromonas sp. MMG010]
MQQKTNHNTIVIYSSARKKGNTSKQVAEYLNKNPVASLCLDDYDLVPYRYDKKYSDDDFYILFEQLLTYQHWVFISPVYWYSTTVQMKIFIDRITDYMDDEKRAVKLRTLREKRFSILSNATSIYAPSSFIDMFKNTFFYLGMTFVGHEHKQTR